MDFQHQLPHACAEGTPTTEETLAQTVANLAAGQKVKFASLKELMNKMTNPTQINNPVENLTDSIQGMNLNRNQRPPHLQNHDIRVPYAPTQKTHNKDIDSNQFNGTRLQSLYREPHIRENSDSMESQNF